MNRFVAWIAVFLLCSCLSAFAQQSELRSFTVYVPYSGFSPYYDGLKHSVAVALHSENEFLESQPRRSAHAQEQASALTSHQQSVKEAAHG